MEPLRGGSSTARDAVLALALALLASGGQAQVVEYYHLDALGSVRAVSSQAGQLVERHDYLPYGEECTTPPCSANPEGTNTRKFTAKERDAESGLDYFGARYYGSRLGRFTTVDPAYTWKENLVDPQRWNRYAYALNNPFRYIDPDGRWPSKLGLPEHQSSIDRSLPDVSQADRRILQIQQDMADAPENQTTARAFTHAMAGVDADMQQSVAQARQAANAYVRNEIEQARYFENIGAHVSALAHLGNAMHTLQDATSPAHAAFQSWNGSWGKWNWQTWLHIDRELPISPMTTTAQRRELDAATRRAYDYFTGARAMPSDFFSDR